MSGESADLTYDKIEQQTVDRLPMLEPAARRYWEAEGAPGDDPGPTIFLDSTLIPYLRILAAMEAAPARNALLQQAFAFVEQMGGSPDPDVRDAHVHMLIYPRVWWLSRCGPYIGTQSQAYLKQYFRQQWKEARGHSAPNPPRPDEEIIDVYGVRDVILEQLQSTGIGAADVPGLSTPGYWRQIESLEAARSDPEGAVFLSWFRTAQPCVICPAEPVACTEEILSDLARDLADMQDQQPGQRETQVAFFRVRIGDRVWQMNIADRQHTRYQGKLWIADQFTSRGTEISEILAGKRTALG